MTEEFEIADAECSTDKEVFAFFGLATYTAHVLEAEAINLCVAIEASGKLHVYSETIDGLFQRYEMRTFGTLLRTLRNDPRVPADLRAKYETASVDRNRLAHSFFREHAEDFLSDAGRAEMIEELRQMTINFRAVDAVSERITHGIWHDLGITEEFLITQYEAMQKRVLLRDAAM